jgi:glycosyltransferase involved in cell wall biosynthesis
MATIAVIVSCYKPHLEKLRRLLESINVQTRTPEEVIVSCSSVKPSDISAFPEYKFKFQIVSFEERRNAAQNRNTASRLASTDYLTYIDADDIMHPQRIEALHAAISSGAEFIMHNFMDKTALQKEFELYPGFEITFDCLRPAPSGCVVQTAGKLIHHSQSTVKRRLFGPVIFNEDKFHERREDAVFCNAIVRTGAKTAYIANKLSKYDEAGFWES